jgi:glycosyltransferase involved in cell wall biosynthesis
MEPISVVHVDNMMGYGGAEQAILQLMRQLRPDEFRLTVIELMRPRVELPGLHDTPHEVVSLHGKRKLSLPVARVARLLSERRAQVLQTHLSRPGLLGSLVPRRGRLRTIHTLHSTWPTLGRLNQYLDRCAFGRADLVVCVSRGVLESVPAGLRRGRDFRVIHNGVDVEALAQAPCDGDALRTELGLHGRGPIIGLVGRLHPAKGHEVLLRALPQVLGRHSDAVVICAGDGRLAEPLTALSLELGVQDAFRLLGFRQDRLALMKLCDVLVMPSLWEGLPMALLEACAVQAPVVCSDVPAFLEVIEDGSSGLVAPRGDAEALAARLLEMLSDRDAAARMATRAYETVCAGFSGQAMAAQYAEVYRSLAGA